MSVGVDASKSAPMSPSWSYLSGQRYSGAGDFEGGWLGQWLPYGSPTQPIQACPEEVHTPSSGSTKARRLSFGSAKVQLDAQQWSQPRWPRLLLLPVEPGDVGLQSGHIGLEPGGVGGWRCDSGRGRQDWRRQGGKEVAGGGWRGEGGELGWAGAGGAHHSVYRQRSERTERPMTSMSASRHSWQ